MRVILVSIDLDSTSSSENLQRLIRAIDQSAASSPLPDLLVLPGACDTGGVKARSTVVAGTLTAIKETVAAKAREWGIYIAIGLHRLESDSAIPYAALFDSDGDLLNIGHIDEGPVIDDKADGLINSHQIATPVGHLILAEPSTVEPVLLAQQAHTDALVVVPWSTTCVPKAKRKAWSTFFAKLKDSKQTTGHLYWAVAAAAEKASKRNDDYQLTSRLVGQNGTILTSAKLGESKMLTLDVELDVPVS